ncbi:MAG: FkbM family methyltransferase, partial [Pseudomonadota bacterium]
TLGYGEYSLSPFREKIRRLSTLMPANRVGRWAISLLRKLTVAGHQCGTQGPYDIEVAPGVRARLFPASNLCEKRAFCGVQNWDSAERAALTAALRDSQNDPFVFLDVGANVGLYSLFLWSAAERLGKSARVIAVEPDPMNRSRLEFNITANNASINVEPIAIGNKPGQGTLGGGAKNRGEVRLSDKPAAGGTEVAIETLPQLFLRHGLTRVDAMKIDIEGHDLEALRCLFSQAPASVWPRLLIVETGDTVPSPVVSLITANGYELVASTRLNAILRFTPS